MSDSQPATVRDQEWPLVSVVIPMRNEADSIEECLGAILAQDYPAQRIEILVVDGKSDDGSEGIITRLAEADNRIRLLKNPKRIVPTAMNIAIRAARGDIICRVDGHTRIATDYVRTGVEVLRRTGADNVGGAMTSVGGGVFGDAVAAAMSSRFGIGAYFHFGTEEREVDTVYLGMWPRAVFNRIGLFDEELVRNQDDELNYRLRKLGGRVVLSPSMRSWYQNRIGVRKLAKQFFQYGEWKVRVLQKHPMQMSWRHFVPPAFLTGILAGFLLAGVAPLVAEITIGVLLLYSALLLIVARSVAKEGWHAWAATGAAFAIIHFSWGGGFLSGLLRFHDRWGRPEKSPPCLELSTGETAAEQDVNYQRAAQTAVVSEGKL